LVPAQSTAAAFQSLGCGTIRAAPILAGMADLGGEPTFANPVTNS
jgi:hypothetical protein